MPMRSLKPAVLYFALVLGTGFVMGTIRVPFLVPRLGERYADLLEMPFMFAAIVLAARHVVRRFALPASLSVRLQVGFVALALSVAAELLFATVRRVPAVAPSSRRRDRPAQVRSACGHRESRSPWIGRHTSQHTLRSCTAR